MGSRKFLVIFISIFSALALLLVGASALEVADKASPPLKSPPSSVVAPKSAFRTTYEYRTSGAPNSNTLLGDLGNNTYRVYYVYLRGTSNTGAFTYPIVEISSDSSFDFRFYSEGTTCYADIDGVTYTVGYKGTYIDFVCGSFEPLDLVSDAYLVSSTISPTFDIRTLFGGMITVWTQFIVFVTSSWVVCLPLIAFVLVICISVIRRIVKGV